MKSSHLVIGTERRKNYESCSSQSLFLPPKLRNCVFYNVRQITQTFCHRVCVRWRIPCKEDVEYHKEHYKKRCSDVNDYSALFGCKHLYTSFLVEVQIIGANTVDTLLKTTITVSDSSTTSLEVMKD
jgi:hypothetical protein